jgi:STE24 endopeptidase
MPGRKRSTIDIPGLDVARAKRYSRTRLAVLAASTLWTVTRLVWFARNRRAARLKAEIARGVPDQRLVAPAFFATATVLSWLSGLPAAFLGGYLVERRFGLTRQPARGWFGDQFKGLVVGLLLQTPLLVAVYAVIRRRPTDWWLVLSAAAVPLTVVLSNLAPVLLMPLFNRFAPIADREIGERIRQMGTRAGVRISDVYVMDMSRQSEKPNALFTGIGNTKRIVLGDTLLDRFAPDEVDAVVAHELGHQVHGDLWRLIGFGAVSGFATAWSLSSVIPTILRRTSGQTGVSDAGDEASLPEMALTLTAMSILLMPVHAAFSRAMERRADRFALEITGDGAAYARAMERLAAQSLADPDPQRHVIFMLYSHPPIADRIRAARLFQRSREAKTGG